MMCNNLFLILDVNISVLYQSINKIWNRLQNTLPANNMSVTWEFVLKCGFINIFLAALFVLHKAKNCAWSNSYSTHLFWENSKMFHLERLHWKLPSSAISFIEFLYLQPTSFMGEYLRIWICNSFQVSPWFGLQQKSKLKKHLNLNSNPTN